MTCSAIYFDSDFTTFNPYTVRVVFEDGSDFYYLDYNSDLTSISDARITAITLNRSTFAQVSGVSGYRSDLLLLWGDTKDFSPTNYSTFRAWGVLIHEEEGCSSYIDLALDPATVPALTHTIPADLNSQTISPISSAAGLCDYVDVVADQAISRYDATNYYS